jgi:serine/threonine-protein kinase
VSTEIDVGARIAGKYELVRLLGKGAMGEVWLAKHESLGGDFAIKLVRPSDDIEDETAAGRFQLEAQVSAKLSRKTRHIVSVSDHGEEDGIAYIVMEVLEGESLEARLLRAGSLGTAEVIAIVMQITRALTIAHAEGIFHRDLKPANVFLTKDEDGRLLVKLLDFGIARTVKPMRTRSPFATAKDMVLGTPSYMSPEQARGLDTLDYRCDLWALCVCAYEALAGTIPWEGESVEDIFLSICTFRFVPVHARRPELPAQLGAIFARAFAAKLEDRFAQATEVSEAFESLCTPEEIEAAMGGRAPSSARRMAVAVPMPMSVPTPTADLVAVSYAQDRKRSGAGWIWAAVAGIATVGVVIALVWKFAATSAPASAASAPPVEAKTTSAPVPPPSATPAETKADPPTQPTPKPTAAPRPAARPPAATAAPPPATTPVQVTATATPTKPPPPRPTHEANEVF